MDRILQLSKQVKAISDIGLLYSKDEYNLERYKELNDISLELMHILSNEPVINIRNFFTENKDYPTPKVDVRGLTINAANEILLVKESSDNKWTLPGGWADIGFSASESIIKEYKEETGLTVKATQLLAVFDKKFHPHPPQPFYVYKFVFLCEIVGEAIFDTGFDKLDAAVFPVTALPELSIDRILQTQIEMLFTKIQNSDFSTYFD